MTIAARQPYTGHAPFDDLLERARRKAERDGRLRFVVYCSDRISLRRPKPDRNYYIMGAADWAVVTDSGQWLPKVYRGIERSTP